MWPGPRMPDPTLTPPPVAVEPVGSTLSSPPRGRRHRGLLLAALTLLAMSVHGGRLAWPWPSSVSVSDAGHGRSATATATATATAERTLMPPPAPPAEPLR